MRANDVTELVRGVVRPTVTWCLVAGQVGLALLWALGHESAEEAAAMLGPFTMMAATFYFKSRDEARAASNREPLPPQPSLTIGAGK